MSDTSGAAAGNFGQRVKTWVLAHKPVAAGGAAAAGVTGVAVYRRRSAAAAGQSDPTATDLSNTPAAGLSGGPADYTSQIEGYVQDALNAQGAANRQYINRRFSRLRHRHRPAVPHTPPPAPRPGSGVYRIQRGDTLAHISKLVYGNEGTPFIHAIKVANPVLMPFPKSAKLNWLAGDVIHIPRAPRGASEDHHRRDRHRRRRAGTGTALQIRRRRRRRRRQG